MERARDEEEEWCAPTIWRHSDCIACRWICGVPDTRIRSLSGFRRSWHWSARDLHIGCFPRNLFSLLGYFVCSCHFVFHHSNALSLICRVEASARDQLIRHAWALSGLRPAPPPSADWREVSDIPRQSAADLPRRAGIREEGDMI